MTREIVLDTETTGLKARGGDRLVEIGCVELVNHFPSGVTWHHYFNPQRDMPAEAYAVHGLSEEFLGDKPLFEELADEFLDFISSDILVIHNASFDIGFLNAELQRVDRSPIGMERVVDTLQIARRKHPGGPNNLDALCKRYEIDNSSRTLHGALLDSEILAEVYIELIGGRQADLGLNMAGNVKGTGSQNSPTAFPRPKPLAARLTRQEIAAHREFIAEIGDKAIWLK